MGNVSLPITISALAELTAAQFPDSGELALLAAIFTQLGDSLATIAVQRELCLSRAQSTGQEGSSPTHSPRNSCL
ncbi:MAG: DUF6774 domain-containing protein [Candidatus Heteroscillospira sp.]|jgi:hypothetical protein